MKPADKNRAWVPPSIESRESIIWPVLILVAGTIICLTFFINKAFHIDDPLFVWTAKQIQANPLDFYGFIVNWTGQERPMHAVTMNPPLNSYFIAIAAYFVGWKEVAIHLVFFLPAVAVVLGTYFLARLLCPLPFLAACIALTTPVLMISSTNVMCDPLMLAFWVWAIFFWIRGLEGRSNALLLFSAILIALGTLTKFVAVSLIPLLLSYSVFKRRRLGIWACFLLIPLVFMAGYEWITTTLYGTGHITSAVTFTSLEPPGDAFPFHYNFLVGLAFTGGCLLNVLFFAPFLWSRRVLVGAIASMLVLSLWIVFLNIRFLHNDDGVLWMQVAQMSLFCVTGVGLLVAVALDFWEKKDAGSLLLLFWIGGIFVFLTFVNWTINGRTVLIMTPAFGILLARRVGRYFQISLEKSYWKVSGPIALSAVLAFLVTRADYQMANKIRYAANDLLKTYKQDARFIWFAGNWGFQFYMQAGGAKSINIDNIDIGDGDVVIIPNSVVVNSKLKLNKNFLLSTHQADQAAFSFLATMDKRLGAGFYAHQWGPLPFAFGEVPPYQYIIHRF